MSESPLAIAAPDSLDYYFLTDPMKLADRELSTGLIPEIIRRRNEFASAEAAKALAPKKARTKTEALPAPEAAKLDIPPSELSLDDI